MATLQMTDLWRLGSVGLLLAAAGCATSSERIARYIAKHPERPAHVCAALVQNTVVPGMAPEEVRLALGGPNRIDRPGPEPIETWHYFEHSNMDGLEGSSLWAMEIPVATVYFSNEGVVEEAIFHGSTADEPAETTDEPVAAPAPQPPTAKARPLPEPSQAEPPLPPPYAPAPDELGVSGWPRISLQGVSVMGADQSAILNGDVFEPGDNINDVTLFRVFVNGVLLDYRGQRTFLRPGNTTK